MQLLPLYEKEPGYISNKDLEEKKFSSVQFSRSVVSDSL